MIGVGVTEEVLAMRTAEGFRESLGAERQVVDDDGGTGFTRECEQAGKAQEQGTRGHIHFGELWGLVESPMALIPFQQDSVTGVSGKLEFFSATTSAEIPHLPGGGPPAQDVAGF